MSVVIPKFTKAKVCIIGRGALTKVQEELIRKAFGDFEIVKAIPQLESNVLKASKQVKGCDIAISLVNVPQVLYTLWLLRAKGDINTFATFEIEQVKVEDVETPEEGKKMCEELGGDIINTKIVNGKVSVRCGKTKALVIEPRVMIKYYAKVYEDGTIEKGE